MQSGWLRIARIRCSPVARWSALDSFVALAVELGIENLLPGAEVELSVGDWDNDFVVNDQRLQVRVSVVLAGLVMLVVLAEGSQRFQPLVDVLDQAAFIVVDVDSGSDVHGGHQNHTVFDSGLFQGVLDLRGQVDVGSLGFRVQGEVFGVEFHRHHLKQKSDNHGGHRAA